MPNSFRSWSRPRRGVNGRCNGGKYASLVLTMLLASGVHAHAEPGFVEAGAKLGPSWDTQSGDRALAENVSKLGGAAGATLRYGLLDAFAVQLELLYVTRGTDLAVQGGVIGGFHLSYLELPALARLEWRVPILADDGRTPPLTGYLIVGPSLSYLLGAERIDDSGSQDLPRDDLSSFDFSAIGGAGIFWNVTPAWGASFEARYEWGFVDAFDDSMSTTESKNRAILLTLGVDYRFNDHDGDRLADGRDGCPGQAEDWNDYRDADGCPDADEDGDGIAIGIDECPEQAENANGYQDQDGCPEADDDDDGIVGSADKCLEQPEDRNGYKDLDGCPDADEDIDGILVDVDKCPEQAEGDPDGFADEDGCPDPDNDGDGLLDEEDICPMDAFPYNRELEHDRRGCPPSLAEAKIEENRITLTPALEFDRNKDKLSKAQKQALDKVAEILRDYYPQKRLRLRGHADGEGKKQGNQSLSKQRADAVANYLASRGIKSGRLVPIGVGEDEPIRREEAEVGKRKNRRVELIMFDD
jgi:outer membrane protein OmpA-like peptidoglycan-associated protein